MVPSYHPPQQVVRAKVLTTSGWLEGTFHMGKLHAFSEYLGHHTWYPMTDVVMEKVGALPFFALARSHTLLVALPTAAVENAAGAGVIEQRRHTATLLTNAAAIDGELALMSGVRLSDFIERTTGYLWVHNASVKVWAEGEARAFTGLLVNPQHLVGVTEAPPSPT